MTLIQTHTLRRWRAPTQYDSLCIFYQLLGAGETPEVRFTSLTYIPALRDMEEEMRQAIESRHAELTESGYQILGWLVSDMRIEVQVFEQEVQQEEGA